MAITAQQVLANAKRRIARLSIADANAYLARIREAGHTMDIAAIRELTGGYASQSINVVIIRALAIRAGIIRRI
jgi:hypothetical protein